MAGKPCFKLDDQEGFLEEKLSQNQGVSLLQTWEQKINKRLKKKKNKTTMVLDKTT